MKYIKQSILLILLSMPVQAKEVNTTIKIIYKEAKAAKLNTDDIIRIAYIESRINMDAIPRINSNGTIDYGLFQINSIHWDTTCKQYDITTVVGNTKCAIKIILQHKKFSTKDPNWLGRYHSKTPSKKLHYLRLLRGVSNKSIAAMGVRG